ncbi:Spc7 kinetochore protein-domain-containing protein [Crassisporium funariophilum]|nr:Spc7 kinetochore protein-domain-containing protein [Crassisporium funariophilum]
MAKKISPNRRRSIAVTNQNQPSIVPKGRRRAHSIVPGVLSPRAKARRSLSQPAESSQSSALEDDNATKSMDYTQESTYSYSRKSLGRRVSFAASCHLRVIPHKKKSTGSPQSSPVSITDSPEAPRHQTNNTNENDYPGQTSRQRRSSLRYSMAQSEDMDLTSIAPIAFQARGSAILDEEFDEYDDDMDVTEALQGNFAQKRSLSMGNRQSLSHVQSSPGQSDMDESRSDVGNESTESDATSEQSQVIEYTVPLGQSLRPAEQDKVWLALKQVANSTPDPQEPMDLEVAISRLRTARDSLSTTQQAQDEDQHESQDDSFTNTEDSFDDDGGDKTMNLSQVLGRSSIGGMNYRMSLGYESNMDESEVYGTIMRTQQTPRQSMAPITNISEAPKQVPSQQPAKPSVFQAPPSNTIFKKPTGPETKASNSVPFSFTPKPTFSAAFAPPVARPSPKKVVLPSQTRSSPNKRPRPAQEDDNENMDIDGPSPAKRQALLGKYLGAAETSTEQDSSAPSATNRKPNPLSPSKKARFEAPAPEPASTAHSSALRRPSGYYAKRKSLAVSAQPSGSHITAPSVIASPRKKAAIGLGRKSLGMAPADAWTRFDKNIVTAPPNKAPASKPTAKEKEADSCIRETARQASVSPSPTRGSPAPTKPASPGRVTKSSVPQVPVVDVSHIVDTNDIGELSGDMEIDTDATQQWREGVQRSEFIEEDAAAISVAQFFSMTGITFMDELTAPRRSIHPSQQPMRQPRNPADIPLAEYVTAMAIDMPQLVLYSRVSKDLEAWMAKSKAVFAQAEEEAAKVTPELFVEYTRADEEGQAELLHQLNLIRTHTRSLAKSDWYDWKLQWVEGLRVTADKEFLSLESDARALEDLKKSADSLIPDLEREYEELERALVAEQAEVAEIEESDQDYLNELKATVAEQNIEIEALKAELSEGKDQLRWLQERSQEIDTHKREAKNTIATAERILNMKKNSTRSEVFRLKDELAALEDLHMFRITKVNSDIFEYVYASLFHVSIPCKNFTPKVTEINISRFRKANTRYKDDFPQLSSFLLGTAKQLIVEGDDLTVREVVHRLCDYWSSCAQFRSQLTLLNIKFPVEVVCPTLSRDKPASFKVKAMVMLPSVKGKAFVSFIFPFNAICQWPTSIDSLDCEVDVAYGPVDRSDIMKAVMSRLSQATPSDNYACLLDACIEAQDVYQ